MNKKMILLFGLVLVTLFSARAFALTNVTSCQALDSAGETYNLINDVGNMSGSYCFEISADDITLDCQNHLIQNVGDRAISGSGVNNIIVRNCRMDNVSLTSDTGIKFDTASNIAIDNCYVNNTNDNSGIFVDVVSNVSIANNVIENVAWGVMSGGSLINITGNNISAKYFAVYSTDGSSNVSVVDNDLVNGIYFANTQFASLINNRVSSQMRYLVRDMEYPIIARDNVMTVIGDVYDSVNDFSRPQIMMYNAPYEWSNNTINGVQQVLYENLADTEITPASGVYWVGFQNCSNVTLKDYAFPNGSSILLSYSDINLKNISIEGDIEYTTSNMTADHLWIGKGLYGIDAYPPDHHLNMTITNSVLENGLYGTLSMYDVSVRLTNVAWNGEQYYYWSTTSDLERYWDMNVDLNANADIEINDSKGNVVYSGTGDNVNMVVLDYTGSCPAGDCPDADEVRDYYSPYTISSTADNYLPLFESFDFSGGSDFSFNMLLASPTGRIITDIGSGIGNFLSAIYLPLGNLILILGVIAGVVAIFMGIAYVIKVAMNR